MFRYKQLYQLQDDLVEHQEPKDNGNVSYFIEAAGDIFRELTLEIPDHSYMNEKLKKLNKFKHLTVGDIRELTETWNKRPAYKTDLLQYMEKVNQLAEVVDKTNFGEDIDRKQQMLRALAVIEDIVNFGVYGSKKAEDSIDRLFYVFSNNLSFKLKELK